MSKAAKGKKGASEDSALTPLSPPWPVWTDAALNSEKWDAVIQGIDQEKKPTGPEYVDPAGHGELPATLVATAWTRAPELFPKLNVVANEKASPYDVTVMNTHLLKSRLMRSLLSDIASLMFLAETKPFSMEMQGPTFVPSGGPIWKPWHHIYANCKAGKGVKHKPGVNKVGKYVVRLFYLGNWRKIIVDDFIPIDENGKPLMPVTPDEGELWLPLLAKALVRIASFSWSDENEIVDFSVITCLTGWLSQSFSCTDIPMKYIWCICQKLLLSDAEDENLKYAGVPQDPIAGSVYATPPIEGHRVPDPLYEMKTSDELEILGSVVMFAVTSERPMLVQSVQPKYAGQSILITDADIYSASDRPPTPLWKKFRWKEWAMRTGLLKNAEREINRVKLFVPIRKSESSAENDKESDSTLSGSNIDDESKNNKKNKVKNGKKDDKKGGSKKPEKESDQDNKELDEWWCLTDLIPYLSRLVVYYRPSSFETVFTLSDMTLLENADCRPPDATPGSAKSKRKEPAVSCVPISPARDCLHHSLCLYADNMFSKKILLSFSILSDAVEKAYHMRISKDKDATQRASIVQNYHVLGEEYTWTNTGFGKVTFCLGTKGTKTTLLQLREGACSLRIWLKVPQNFSLNIMSQVPFTIGPLEKLQQLLSTTSTSLAFYAQNIALSFAKLQKTIGKDYTEKTKELQEFYASYQPTYFSSEYITKTAMLIEKINCAFEKAMVSVLLERVADDVDALTSNLKYLQQLFTKSDFGVVALKELSPRKAEAVNAKLEEELKALEQQTEDESQKGKKGKKGKEDKSTKSAGSSKKGKDTDRLCSFFETPEVCSELLVQMVKFCPSVLCLYQFRDELRNRMSSEEFRGIIKLPKVFSSDGWQLIVRFIVNTHSEESSLGALFFVASIKSFVFRIINNDTGEEIAGYPFGSLPFSYSKNKKGYTVIAYGIPDLLLDKEIKWCLRIVSRESKCLLHRCPAFEYDSSDCKHLPPTQTVTKDLSGYYIPNSEKKIFRCILTTSNEQLLSFRFYCSNDRVRFHVTLKEMYSTETVMETAGIGSILVPAFLLEVPQKDTELSAEECNDENALDQRLSSKKGAKTERALLVFIVEAFVIRNSWNLSQEDKVKVREVKDMLASSGLIDLSGSINAGSSDTTLKRPISKVFSAGSSTSLVPGAPFWSMQVTVDADRATETSLEFDTQREEEIRQMKIQWEIADPGRRRKAHALRNAFLEERSQQQEIPLDTKQRSESPRTTARGIIEQILQPVGEVVVDAEYRDNLEAAIKQSLEDLENFKRKMHKKHQWLLWRQGYRNQLVEKDHLEKKLRSVEMIRAAYSQRTAYIESHKEVKTVKKGKK